MYNRLFFAIKQRIIGEIIDTFTKHPAFTDKIKVYHKFPYGERIQYGVVLRNTGSGMIRMSADNYLGELKSHVALARAENFPGYSIEWVREDARYVTSYQEDEDVSSQLGPTQRLFQVSKPPIVSGLGNTDLADNIGQVLVTINGRETPAEFVDGKNGLVLIPHAPNLGDAVKVSYYYKSISPAGRYYVVFTEDNQFEVDQLLCVEGETEIENTLGTETSLILPHSNIADGSDRLYLLSRNGSQPIILTKGTDYTLDILTSTVTFLTPLLKNLKLLADYRYKGITTGPYTFAPYEEIDKAINGVVISIGRRAKKGDKQVVLLSNFREPMAQVYGGHWDMTLSLGVISKDSIQSGEMSDFLAEDFWGNKKNILEFEGITMTSITPSGETEEVFDSVSNDMYYETNVDINLMTEWQKFVPYLYKIKDLGIDLRGYPKMSDFYVTKNLTLEPITIISDQREVIKYPIVGYERVI